MQIEDASVQNRVFVVLFLFLSSLFGSAIAESLANTRQAPDDQTYFELNESNNGPYQDLDHPFGPKGTPPGEASNEKDSETEIDDEDGKESCHRSINRAIAFTSTASSWLCCAQLSQNHHSVSLFILYHSWKSHLS